MPDEKPRPKRSTFLSSLDQPPATDVVIGALLGYFLLHPVALAIVGQEVSLPILVHSFSSTLGAYFAFIGMMTGFIGGIFRHQLKRQNKKLAEANEELSAAVAERESLLRIISHDITNAMVSASAALTLVERRAAKTQQTCSTSADFTEIASEARETLANAQHLLDFTKRMLAIQSGKLVMVLEKQDVRPIVTNAAALYKEKAEKKNVDLVIEAPDSKVLCAVEPTVLLNTVLGNLVSNAVKFSLPGMAVRIGLAEQNSHVLFSVANIGPCIPDALGAKLFSPGACTTRPGTCGEPGTGFGLPLVAQFVEKMNGAVSVESVPAREEGQMEDGGDVCRTTFTVRLPLVRPSRVRR